MAGSDLPSGNSNAVPSPASTGCSGRGFDLIIGVTAVAYREKHRAPLSNHPVDERQTVGQCLISSLMCG
tara:strand:- start:299 stop:505 length:207 start_codon:yes stop_codon:yes gene_type:complete